MTKAIIAIAATSLMSQASFASTTCVSKPNQFGGTTSVQFSQNEQNQPTVMLFAQGGAAHFVSQEGPFVATVQQEADSTTYSFVDSFGQNGKVIVITTIVSGKLTSVAAIDFGLFNNSSMICK